MSARSANDRSSTFYGGAINLNRYNVWAAGGLVGYNFGSASLNVWAFGELSVQASGGTPIFGIDQTVHPKGVSVFASLSYRLWAPEEPTTPVVPRLHK